MTEFKRIIAETVCIEQLKNNTIMITGATGTIGSYLLELLSYYNAECNAGIQIICPVRRLSEKSNALRFLDSVKWIEYDFTKELTLNCHVDYLIHCAGPTRSKEMIERPVDTIGAIVLGTENMLKFFRKNGRKSFLYLSTVEIYGENFNTEKKFYEDTLGAVNTLDIRSSYPEAKRLAETLCMAYASQYGLPIKISRLSQILGVGKNDNRLIAYLCDCARNKKQIVLKSDGKAIKAYCYVADCVSALIYILVNGDNTAYNVADTNLILSVRAIAEFVSKRYIGEDVLIENTQTKMYPKSSSLIMNTDKLCKLGWHPMFKIEEAFDALILKTVY